MFSATWKPEIQQIASKYCPSSIKINIGKHEVLPNDKVKQNFISFSDASDHMEKFLSLVQNLNKTKEKTLIFCSTKHGAKKLSNKLNEINIMSGELHGNVEQKKRESILGKFKSSQILFLVATDVASRGLDVNDISTVINFEFPKEDIESYVHRIGRTGRAGKSGQSFSFIGKNENIELMVELKSMLEKQNKQIPECVRYFTGMSESQVKQLQLAQKAERRKKQELKLEFIKKLKSSK
jgi:ATP-dependent RNA helicase DDX5/DBP2